MRLALLALAALRFYGRHPWQLVLAVAGIALGIAVFVGIELANDSARRAFDSSSAAVRGQTTHRLLPLSGMLDESVYVALKRDRRISYAPGDPLPHLECADLCVHPSYCDGYGYGPAEAMACGVPVVATEDTGMKEEITPGKNGWIVPTGDVFSIVDVLRSFRPTKSSHV